MPRAAQSMANAGRLVWILLLLAAIPAHADEPLPPPPLAEFLIVPVRIHVLACPALPDIDCALTDADIERIVLKANRAWHQAGIHLGVERIVREPAANVAGFEEARRGNGGTSRLGDYRLLFPDGSRADGMLHVYFVHALSVNGVYLGDGSAVVKETARLRPVEGGFDEPIPRVTSHELGHALGLAHHPETSHLLASGTTGFVLGHDEAAHARSEALRTQVGRTLADCEDWATDLEARGESQQAARVRGWRDRLESQLRASRDAPTAD